MISVVSDGKIRVLNWVPLTVLCLYLSRMFKIEKKNLITINNYDFKIVIVIL